jgi:hypothetical protein
MDPLLALMLPQFRCLMVRNRLDACPFYVAYAPVNCNWFYVFRVPVLEICRLSSFHLRITRMKGMPRLILKVFMLLHFTSVQVQDRQSPALPHSGVRSMYHRRDARTSIVLRHHGVQSIISVHTLPWGFWGEPAPFCIYLVRIFPIPRRGGGGGRRWTVALRKRPEQEWLHTGVFCK